MDPVVLDSGTINLASTGATLGPPDTSRLTMDAPWWLDEIVLDLGATSAGTTTAAQDIWVQLRIGSLPVTKDYVPVSVLTERPNLSEQSLFKWKLPKPLYMPPLVYLQPTFRYDNTLNASGGAVKAAVSYQGRRADPSEAPPRSVWLPYVGAFVGATQAASATPSEQSTEYDLANPFAEPLVLDYMVGDVESSGSGLVWNTGADYIDKDNFIRIVDSQSRIVVRDRTRLGAVFPATTKIWRTRGIVIPPRGYYLAYVDWSTGGATRWRMALSLVGRRAVTLALIKNTAR